MVEEARVDRGTAKHRLVLAVACALEVGVALAFTTALVHIAVSGMGTSSLGTSETLPIDVVALAALPLVAVLVGALPAMLRIGPGINLFLPLGVSVLVCLGAALMYWLLLLVAGGISVRFVPDAISLLFVGVVSAVPFILVPLLVDRWT